MNKNYTGELRTEETENIHHLADYQYDDNPTEQQHFERLVNSSPALVTEADKKAITEFTSECLVIIRRLKKQIKELTIGRN